MLISIAISIIVSINVGIIIVSVTIILVIPTEVPPRVEVEHQVVEVTDRDNAGVVQLYHDGRLLLQVLEDVGVLDLVCVLT